MASLTLVAVRGLSIAKWIHKVGGAVLLVLFGLMAAFALPRWLHGSSAVAPVALAFPAVSLLNLNILGKMGFGAFCGFDGCAVFSGELRDPNVGRTIRRSIFIAGPAIALIYVLGTACVLTFTRPGDLDLISPPTQALVRATQGTLLAPVMGPLAALLLIASMAASACIYFSAMIRLPMVAGWDHLLPSWLSRLHPRFRTPVGSILLVAGATFAITLLGNLGVGAQEAFQFLNNEGILCWALAYLVMFSIPLLARGERPPLSVRVSAVSGLAMTLLYLVLSTFPIVDVKNSWSFTAKVIAVILVINGAGGLYFRYAATRRETLVARNGALEQTAVASAAETDG
jgi:amino acid transporter